MKASSVNGNRKSLLIFSLILVLFVALATGYFLKSRDRVMPIKQSNDSIESSPTIQPQVQPQVQPQTNNLPVDSQVVDLPKKFLIEDFLFQSQAPQGVWDDLHNEGCEEASVTLVYYYLNHKDLTSAQMDKQISALVDLEEKDGQSQQNLNIQQTLALSKDYYDLGGRVTNNATLEDLKKEISLGYPVIIPTAGRLLGNPNFRNPGPIYHMVVAIGYDQNNIIVQDVGTRNGDHYKYNQKIFFNAWHDWAGSDDNIEQGGKDMLVLSN